MLSDKKIRRSPRRTALVCATVLLASMLLVNPIAGPAKADPAFSYSFGFFYDDYNATWGGASFAFDVLNDAVQGTLTFGTTTMSVHATLSNISEPDEDGDILHVYKGTAGKDGLCLPITLFWIPQAASMSGRITGPTPRHVGFLTSSAPDVVDSAYRAVFLSQDGRGTYAPIQDFRYVVATMLPPVPAPVGDPDLTLLEPIEIPAPMTVELNEYVCDLPVQLTIEQVRTGEMIDPLAQGGGGPASVGCHRCGAAAVNNDGGGLFIRSEVSSEYRYAAYAGSFDDIKLEMGAAARFMYLQGWSAAYSCTASPVPFEVTMKYAVSIPSSAYGFASPLKFSPLGLDYKPAQSSTSPYTWGLSIGIGWQAGPFSIGTTVNEKDDDGASLYLSPDRRYFVGEVEIPWGKWPCNKDNSMGFRTLLQTDAGSSAVYHFAYMGQMFYTKKCGGGCVKTYSMDSGTNWQWRNFKIADCAPTMKVCKDPTTGGTSNERFDVADRGMSLTSPNVASGTMPTNRELRFDTGSASTNVYAFHELVGDPNIPKSAAGTTSGVSTNYVYYAGWYDKAAGAWKMFYPTKLQHSHSSYPIPRDVIGAKMTGSQIPPESAAGGPPFKQRDYTITLWQPHSGAPGGWRLVDHMSFIALDV